MLKCCYSFLKHGGHLFLHIPLKRERAEPLRRFLSKHHEWAAHEHVGQERTKDEVLQLVSDANFHIERWQYTFHYCWGELAWSLYAIFFENTFFNRILQAAVAPLTRLLCYGELAAVRGERFALGVLAKKI